MDNKNWFASGLLNIFMFSAIFLAFGIIVSLDPFFGFLYLFLVTFSILLVIKFWCSKCPCNAYNCSHIWFGKLSAKYFSQNSGEYTPLDSFIQLLYIFIIMIYPLPWMVQKFEVLVLFLILNGISFLIGPFYHCCHCENFKCHLCRKKL